MHNKQSIKKISTHKLEEYILKRFTKDISLKHLKEILQDCPNYELWEIQDFMVKYDTNQPLTYLDYIDTLTVSEFYLFIKHEAKFLKKFLDNN